MSVVSRRDAFKLATATGLVAMTGRLEAAEEKKPEDKKAEEKKDWWRAWAVTEGDKTKLVVEGIFSAGAPGLVLEVKDAVSQGTNPKILILQLKKTKLPGIWAEIVIPVPAWYVKAPYKKGEYDSIQVRYPDNTYVNIPTITDAGAGPT